MICFHNSSFIIHEFMRTFKAQHRDEFKRKMFIVVAIYIVLATIYSITVPVWEAPDELGHYAYIKHLRLTRTLPIQGQHVAGEAHQPPLYYAIAALVSLPADFVSPIGERRPNPQFMWSSPPGQDININILSTMQTIPFQGQAWAIHLARFASVAMGAATVTLIIRIGSFIFPDRREIGLLAGVLASLTPQFLFITGVLNNDNLLILCSTGALWHTLRAIKEPEKQRYWVFVGVWLSAAILTKLTAVAIVAVVGIVICAIAWQKRSLSFLWRPALWITLIMLITTGWWFWRNQTLYGDPLGNSVYEQLFASNLRQAPLQWRDVRDLFSVQFHSFWATFGWMNLSPPAWYFMLMRVILLLVGLGWGRLLIKRPFTSAQYRSLGLLALALLLQESVIFYIITRCNASCYQGRYLFPAIAPIMLLLAVGLYGLLHAPWSHRLINGITLILLNIAIWMPIGIINPAYEISMAPGWRAWLAPEKKNSNFGNQFVLRSYAQEVDQTGVHLQLYWQAITKPDFDYSTFVHLVDVSGTVVAQADNGLGQAINYLPTAWHNGDMVDELYNLTIPPGLPSGSYQIRVGVYNWSTGERLLVYTADEPSGDFVHLEEVWVGNGR